MQIADHIREQLGESWIPHLYAARVRGGRTRAYRLEIPERLNAPEILYTLLGIELKVGKRRFASPDLATARYLRVFARIGCAEFAVPYDITQISPIADELETSWQRSLLLLNDLAAGKSERVAARLRSELCRVLREEIAAIGPGELMPAFKTSTRQRS